MLKNIIEPIKLLRGTHSHTARTGQGCMMNIIAYLNGESQITDQSECVCFVVRPIAIWFNDFLQDDERHILIPFIERAMGSATKDRMEIARRVHLVADMAERMSIAVNKYAESAAKSAKSAKYAESAESAAKSAESAEFAAKSAESAEFAAKSAELAAEFAAKSAELAEFAAKSAELAAEFAAKSAELAAEFAAKSAELAAESAEFAAKSAELAAEFAAKSAELAAEFAAIREEIKSACIGFLDRALPQQEQGPVVIERAIRLRELVTT